MPSREQLAATTFGFTIHDVPIAIRDAANDVLRLTIAAEGGRMFPTRKEFERCLSLLATLSDNPTWSFLR